VEKVLAVSQGFRPWAPATIPSSISFGRGWRQWSKVERHVGVAGKHLWPSEAQLPNSDMVGVEGLGGGDKHITRGVVEDRNAVEPGPRHFLIAYLACLAPLVH